MVEAERDVKRHATGVDGVALRNIYCTHSHFDVIARVIMDPL